MGVAYEQGPARGAASEVIVSLLGIKEGDWQVTEVVRV